MRVLVLTPPLGSAGGIQRYTLTLIRALQDLFGEESVRVVSMRERSLPQAVMARMAMPLGVKLRFGWQAMGGVARWRPDLIVCTHLALGPVGWLVATLGERPYWIVVYGIEAWGALTYAKRAALQQADRVVVISAFSREQVVKRQGIDRECISSLPCALDEGLLSCSGGLRPPGRRSESAATAGATADPFGPDRRVLLTVARLAASERYKGHDVVLRALPAVVAQVPNLTYAVVGDGDDRARLERLARELGLAAHVAFTGEVSDGELGAIYRRSEVFVLPARTVIEDHNPKGEGFGIVYLEAMAFGKPVIGPSSGAPADLIRHGENGLLVDPEDAGAVGEAIVKLLEDPEAARAMGAAGEEWVREHYSHAAFRERLGKILEAKTGVTCVPLNATHASQACVRGDGPPSRDSFTQARRER